MAAVNPSVPMSQAFPQIDAVFDRCGELFDSSKISPHNGFGLFAHMPCKTFDSLILRRPGTLPKRIPLLRPATASQSAWLGFQRQRSPDYPGTLEAILGYDYLAVGKLKSIDTGGDDRPCKPIVFILLIPIGLGRLQHHHS